MTRRLRIVTIDNTVGATSCPETALPSEAPESIPIFSGFCVVFVYLYLSFRRFSVCIVFIQITHLVSSNFSYKMILFS
jgi:hypothetical protein